MAPIVLGLVGTWLLVREVWLGHKFEELSRDLDDIRELQEVYSLNPREYLIRNWMFGSNLDRARATERVDINNDAEIQQYADEAFAAMDAQAAATLEAWRTIGRRTFMRIRRGLLLMGGGALIAGLAISLLAEIAKIAG
jgi:hypothetical protein